MRTEFEACFQQKKAATEELQRLKAQIETCTARLRSLEDALMEVDNEIDQLEMAATQDDDIVKEEPVAKVTPLFSATQADEFLTDPTTQRSAKDAFVDTQEALDDDVDEDEDPTDDTTRQQRAFGTLDFTQSHAKRTQQSLNHTTQSWSDQIVHHLRNTFRIPSFRDHQEAIIHSTLKGEDVFVIMRTGGGKSLTYQLPALLEGRGPHKKVTFVVSPLLSLIQDQEEQMNQFCPNSATSFTSGLQGGNAEHARRWSLVRDPNAGVCLVFVTPEKVHKSGKLRAELQKLFDQGRLGRFVIDEAHCACQWGHDFRPDYAQLGALKHQFPSVPVIAVTATASDRVRHDVCKILEIGSNYKFFRSTANRPNLTYSVRAKRDGKDTTVADMAAFIKEKHPNNAGIVYTFSRKDADTVADALCNYGIVARPYHSDVSPKNKELVHRSWMKNQTQVVVATIAFGLGINKPDVRFVLHHTISKSIEAYYQESGRAGRDGKPSDCVLYYAPKDVPRMMGMVQGEANATMFWPMVQYGQASGNDAVCKAIILASLGEPGAPNPTDVQKQQDGIVCEPRDVGKHAKTVAQLLRDRTRDGDNLTLPMLVKEWRAKPNNAPQ